MAQPAAGCQSHDRAGVPAKCRVPGRYSRVRSPMLFRSAVIAAIVSAAVAAAAGQELRVLHIKVTVPDADGRPRPVPRHALLISDNPASAAPRRVVTSLEGTVDVRLRSGNYTIESDDALIYQ